MRAHHGPVLSLALRSQADLGIWKIEGLQYESFFLKRDFHEIWKC